MPRGMNALSDLKMRIAEFNHERTHLLEGINARIQDIFGGFEAEKQILIAIPVQTPDSKQAEARIIRDKVTPRFYKLVCDETGDTWFFTFEKMPLRLLYSVAESLTSEYTWTIEAKQGE